MHSPLNQNPNGNVEFSCNNNLIATINLFIKDNELQDTAFKKIINKKIKLTSVFWIKLNTVIKPSMSM